ncbi:ATP-binding cassette domain-containing protein [Cognatishimia sp. MH4019]|uniref:thiamine ABC transporter ATP-binding protein n=1 Tax=Cognatishimia sp. MH4019 TaxID=2854030 RepID=UPI001CD34255|nr:ATP-binding cassette domain-containing protein [Cognatishimia sp. MH4019]
MLTFENMRVDLGDFTMEGTFEVAKGARVAVMGPSGAGKSTLLNVIAGFQDATGRLMWNGQEIGPLPPAERPVSMVFQDNNLFPHLTAFQNVGLGISPKLKLNEADATRVREALQRVGLEGLEDRKPAALSGGQQSRVAVARMLLREKPLVLLDEPFAALGPAMRIEMLGLVRDLVAETGATLLMITHDPDDARLIADQCILVADGRVEAPVEMETFLSDPPEAMRAYLGT